MMIGTLRVRQLGAGEVLVDLPEFSGVEVIVDDEAIGRLFAETAQGLQTVEARDEDHAGIDAACNTHHGIVPMEVEGKTPLDGARI